MGNNLIENPRKQQKGDSFVGEKEKIRAMTRNMLENTIKNRSLREYLSSLNLNPDELKGKKILDVGSKMALFQKEGKEKGFNVTALDLMYVDEDGRGLYHKNREADGPSKAVAALAQKIPFKKNTFDLITSLYAAFSYVKTVSDIRQSLGETLRVLKKDGELRIYPVEMYDEEPVLTIYELEDSSRLSDIFFEILNKKQESGEIEFSIGRSSNEDDNPFHHVVVRKLRN